MENLIDVFEYDSDGYFVGTTFAQLDEKTHEIIGMPKNCTQVAPELKEGFFYRFDGKNWNSEKIPMTPEECVGIVLSHKCNTPHVLALRKVFHALTNESSTYRLVVGDDNSLSVEKIPEKTEQEILTEAALSVRAKRDRLIAETDYMLMSDYPLDAESLKAVKAYRQALRDVPQQAKFPLEVNWPVMPEIQTVG